MRKAKRKSCPPVALAEPKKETVSVFWPGPNSETEFRVVSMLLDCWNPRQIAKQLNVPYGAFLKWYLDKGTQRYLAARQIEEAEKRRRNAKENTE